MIFVHRGALKLSARMGRGVAKTWARKGPKLGARDAAVFSQNTTRGYFWGKMPLGDVKGAVCGRGGVGEMRHACGGAEWIARSTFRHAGEFESTKWNSTPANDRQAFANDRQTIASCTKLAAHGEIS